MPRSSQPLLILDLDETLFYACESPLPRAHDCRIGPYFAYRRPGLASFLQRCATCFDLAVWSSSTADYVALARQVVLPREANFHFAWARDRCVRRYHPELQEYYYVKDLKKVKRLGYDLRQVLIADDTPRKIERNYGNAVYVKPYFGEEIDNELELLATYLASIAHCDNFRTLEKRNWRHTAQG